jgi:hypothetical protein
LPRGKRQTTAKLIAKPANPRPFPALAPLGVAVVAQDDNALAVELQATGAKLRLEPWDGDIFIARLMPTGTCLLLRPTAMSKEVKWDDRNPRSMV